MPSLRSRCNSLLDLPMVRDPEFAAGLRAYAAQIFGGAQLMKDIGSRMEAIASEADTTTIGDVIFLFCPAKSGLSSHCRLH